jgi:hypothetical protein
MHQRGDLVVLATQLAEGGQLLADAARHNAAVPSDLTTVRLARDLDELAGAALRLSIERAREAGHTWQEIGDLLGVSRQAAFQRFGKPIDPRTGELMNKAVLPGAGLRATELVIDWIEGRYDQVRASFDATMAAQLSTESLAAAWAGVIGMVGEYERMGEPLVRQLGDYTVVDIPLEHEAGTMKARLSFNGAGEVAGLYVLNPDVP